MIYKRATDKLKAAGHPVIVSKGDGYVFFSPEREAPYHMGYDYIDSIMSPTLGDVDVVEHVEESIAKWKKSRGL